jgi:DNA-directed RNA polymerase subunit RPC12/RpoP
MSDGYKALETLKRKFKMWLRENQASREMLCPHCGKKVLLRIRTEAWEAQKHPFFKDRILGNTYLIKLYQQGKLSAQDVANILEASPDYVTWLIDKWKLSPAGDANTSSQNNKTPQDESNSHPESGRPESSISGDLPQNGTKQQGDSE